MDNPHIKVTKDGPYLVYGGLPVHVDAIGTDDEGGSWTWERGQTLDTRETYALCRCGQSSTKPFCDGTHMRIGFDGTETASRGDFALVRLRTLLRQCRHDMGPRHENR